ncbi:hypothetical protein NQ318_009156, partial [Aromia moschata]
ADLYYEIISDGVIKLGKNLPILQNTYLGWIVAGEIPEHIVSHTSTFISMQSDVSLFTHTLDLDNIVTNAGPVRPCLPRYQPTASSDRRMWKRLERSRRLVESKRPEATRYKKFIITLYYLRTRNSQKKIFKNTTRILENGRYQVNLPLKTEKENLKLVKINPSQNFLQNILWRNNVSEPLNCIELQTVTYGTNSAPFLATRVLKDVAERGKENYPVAADALLNQCYVDDILYGSDSYENLITAYQLNILLNSAGFSLHKWCSNSKEFLQNYCNNETQNTYNIKIENFPNKVLGVSWNPNTDNFSVTLPQKTPENNFTKREVLSCLSQMFDPLGLIGPIIVTGKMIMQKIWISKINWDD